jgi:hypothetical protein
MIHAQLLSARAASSRGKDESLSRAVSVAAVGTSFWKPILSSRSLRELLSLGPKATKIKEMDRWLNQKEAAAAPESDDSSRRDETTRPRPSSAESQPEAASSSFCCPSSRQKPL